MIATTRPYFVQSGDMAGWTMATDATAAAKQVAGRCALSLLGVLISVGLCEDDPDPYYVSSEYVRGINQGDESDG